MTNQVRICEVAPRDGLQNERQQVPTAGKVRLIDLLSECGFDRIEVASLVSPKRVPQMADGEIVLQQIVRRAGTRYCALVPNLPGYLRAHRAGADEIAVLVAATEGFSQANLNCSIATSLERARDVAKAAAADGVPVRGYLSTVIACPYDGPTLPATVAAMAAILIELGCQEVSLGDTIGAGDPETVGAMLDHVLALVPAAQLAGHFHDTGGRALANIETSLSRGIRIFDASAGGLGGCPFAPGAAGNVDTRSVVRMLHVRGMTTGVDESKLEIAARYALTLQTERAPA